MSLTCPVAAKMILKPNETMAFEQLEVDEKTHSNGNRILIQKPEIVNSFLSHVIEVQYAAISILQEQKLNIDQRLIVLGFYFDNLEELINKNRAEEVTNLSAVYTTEGFLNEQVPQLIKAVKFNVRDYIKIMFDILETLYGKNSELKNNYYDTIYLDAVKNALKIIVDEAGTVSLNEMVENYNKLSDMRTEFITDNAQMIENYLVNEFFL